MEGKRRRMRPEILLWCAVLIALLAAASAVIHTSESVSYSDAVYVWEAA